MLIFKRPLSKAVSVQTTISPVNMSSFRLVARKILLRPSTRLFTTSPNVQKSATETAKETLSSVNRTVSDAAAKGMEKGGMFPRQCQ